MASLLQTSIITPQGISTLTVSQKYKVENIIDLDDSTLTNFCQILCLQEAKRYKLIYTLAINDLLIAPSQYDLSMSIVSLSISSIQNSIDWVKSNRNILMALDELVVSDGTNLKIPRYGLTLTGKRSDLFQLISGLIYRNNYEAGDGMFEKSFHLLPQKFIGGSEKISNPEAIRNKIRSQIETDFALTENIIERSFHLIDQEYFSGLIKFRLRAAGKRISFKVSYKMTSTAGSMTSKPESNEYVISISSRLNEVLGNKSNSGLVCNGPIDAFLVTLQHEITHLLVHLEMDRLGITREDLIAKRISNAEAFNSHGIIFQNLGERFFGLTERTHSLFEENDTVKVQPSQLSVGSRVSFTMGKDKHVVFGKIKKLNPKNAIVTLDNGKNYNVPYSLLKVI